MPEIPRYAAAVPGAVPVTAWVERYLRIPYRDMGRNGDGCDCWGLVRIVLAERADIHLPTHATVAASGFNAKISEEAEHWFHVKQGSEKPFDVVRLRSTFVARGLPVSSDIHLGIVTRKGWMLHTEEKTGPVHVRLDHPAIRGRVRQIYRHRDLL